MQRHRSTRRRLALAGVSALAACNAVEIDESDHDAFFAVANVRKHLDDTDDREGPFVEVGWSSAEGSVNQLDYSIGTLSGGVGMEGPFAEHGRFSVGGGFAWQLNDYGTTAGELYTEDGFGPYFSIEVGWQLADWLEPYVRAGGMGAIDELAFTHHIELGVKLHLIDHAALYVGWRDAHYEVDDLDSLTIESVELDASGVVVGLDVWF